MKIATVEEYLLDGCGRCSLFATDDCKVRRWPQELNLLREIALECGLEEQIKWGVPCYSLKNKNICMVSAFKDDACLSFFKGALLNDENGLLQKPGENSQASRMLKFNSVKKIADQRTEIKSLIFQAIEIENLGLKIEFNQKNHLVYPDELLQAFEHDEAFRKAFEALTPGRKRSHILHYTSAKQEKTKVSRIEKSRSSVFAGKGWNEY
jgi:uncharacterized protein YdeI (YjbR/CyaY-like superfamily)